MSHQIYAIGGRTGSLFGEGTILNVNEVYDPATDNWATLAPLPIGVSDNYATVAFDGRIYVFGGATNPDTIINTVQIYDIGTDAWNFGAAMPTLRGAALAGVIGTKIAVFGGFDPSTGENLAATELYDPVTNAWFRGPDMLQPASEIAQGVTYNGVEIYAIGSGIFGVSMSTVQVLKAD
jgi:N-acetylneuraminic acid mutarotase